MPKESDSNHTLQVNPLVAELIVRGAETAMIVRGFIGPTTREGFVCLYPSLNNLSVSFEIGLTEILHSVAAPQSVLGAVILWVKRDAKIFVRRVGVSGTASIFARNIAGLRKGATDAPPPGLVELRKGRLRMRVRGQQALADCYGVFCDDCLVDPYPPTCYPGFPVCKEE